MQKLDRHAAASSHQDVYGNPCYGRMGIRVSQWIGRSMPDLGEVIVPLPPQSKAPGFHDAFSGLGGARVPESRTRLAGDRAAQAGRRMVHRVGESCARLRTTGRAYA